MVVEAQLGEREALERLVRAWHGPVHRFLRSRLPDGAEVGDASQEVWLRALRGLPRLEERARFAGWLFGIARRVLVDRLRQRSRRRIDPEAAVDTATAADVEDELDLDALRAGLERLPAPDRAAIQLYHLDGLSIEESAAVLDVPPGTVKSRLHRARRTLERMIR